ncbi:substrate-binding domain-containing protein [Nonomuraea endophytica]|uniref:ABC-type molybdate transport system substrate-binding protein n=1 Tax=Nonomuraea endophytica TaxID=714136 RepID=A0A7W8A982_9ACTN|nr:substrate-binding domain-containing protein [Nonomuraea endophytica]MBB5081928.1 ABC-type molybdate transport system substrate-binding protein [Nonomuraea endophytica]
MLAPRSSAVRAPVTALGLSLLAACGGQGGPADPATSAAGPGTATLAASDKKITVYSGRSEELVKPLLDHFTRETGIAVEARYAATAAMATQLVEEGERSPADVFFAQDADVPSPSGARPLCPASGRAPRWCYSPA